MMRPLSLPSTRRFTSCSVLALATVLVVGATPAAAQSFLGNGTVTSGTGTITTGVNTTNITVSTPQTVIDWIPTDNAIANNTSIAFQNSGTTATFAGAGNYAVLNRINTADPTRNIFMNGTIQAVAAGAAGSANGSIYFYSPGGFVIGANAVINVGSLVLSASPITVTGGNFIGGFGTTNTVVFGQAVNPAARITLNSGAQINTLGTSSYIAIVAPEIVQNSTMTTGGQAVLVAAEAATVRFKTDGLFDIEVTSGTSSSFGISTIGDIGGAASTGAGDNNRIYMVAVPKNQAMTMVIGAGADLGFAVAGAASVDGNAIVLSAGHDIVGGVASATRSAGGGSGNASISAFNFNATSALTGVATFDVRMGATTGSSTFHSDVTLRGVNDVDVTAQNAATLLTIKGNVSLTADKAIAAGTSGSAGNAALYATSGGTIVAEKNVAVSANATGANSSTAGVAGGNATGGRAYVQSQSGGSLTVLGDVLLSATGTGGGALSSGVNAGLGTGGTIQLETFDPNSTLTVGGNITASVNGSGGDASCIDCNGVGGTGTGGSIYVGTNDTADGAVTTLGSVGKSVLLNAQGFGGDSKGGVSAATGTGGSIRLFSRGASTIVNILGDVTANADGMGGNATGAGVDGGVGQGGNIYLYASEDGASISLNNASLQANGTGGRGDGLECFSCDGDGGDGTGGDVFVGDGYFFNALSSGNSLDFTGFLTMAANGTGGAGVGASGDGTGGHAELSWYATTTGSVDGNVSIQAFGDGGDNGFGAGIAGNGKGGSAIISPDGGLTIGGNVFVDATGYGGNAFGIDGIAGDGTGGTSRLFNGVGTIDIAGNYEGYADGFGGFASDGIGGDGTGGLATFNAFESTILVGGQVDVTAWGWGGWGGNNSTGIGGNGTGGTARIITTGGIIEIGGDTNVEAEGRGADGGTGGDGTGGFTRISSDGAGSSITISGATNVSSDAHGGDSNSLVGGSATGGDIDIYAQNGGNLLFDDDLTVRADATGGSGATGGGGAYGGDVNIYSFASLKVDGALTASANATGGQLYYTDFNGNAAGNAFGGDVDVYAQNGLLTLVGGVTLSTDATGGEASNSSDFAGDGEGGTTRLFANAGGTVDLRSTLDATAIGSGGGSDYYYGGGIGGDGQGGDVRVQATGANASVTVAGAATLDATGYGSQNSGGDGTGGTVWADSFGAATASLNFGSDVALYAEGWGGDGGGYYYGGGGSGGNGQGGQALLQASAGSSVSVGGNAIVSTDAFGGYSYDFSDGVGGNATGGTSRIQAFNGTGTGGTIDIEGSATVTANGSGGDSYSYVDGVGGNGTGGLAQLYATPGPVTIGNAQTNGGATISADGHGGNADHGTGGNGTGGTLAEIAAVNGDMTIAGFASVSASGYGGDGLFGGDGRGSGDTSAPDVVDWAGGAHIYAQNGDIVILGGASVYSVGTGGDGGFDNNGYNGDNGGDGGSGRGGWASIHAANSNLGSSSISIDGGTLETSGNAFVNASGTGGVGGDGASGNAGGDGGNGGDGFGGRAGITAAAGNGTINVGVAVLDATASGGNGGQGGNGDGMPGGNGGNGGNAVGGVINVGTESGSGQSGAVNNGVGNYGSIFADASAFGGTGGDGDFGSVSGAGGNGGNAVGGAAVLLVRGSLVDVDNVTLTANATGGDGGLSDGETSPDGNGGNATIGGDGGIGVIVTGRFLIPTQRGTLNAGSISGTASATAGIGEIDGISQTLGGNGIFFSNADGNIESLSFLVQADSLGAGALPDLVVVRNGDVDIDGDFSFITSGNLSLYLDNGDLNADTISWHAADFVPDVQYGTPETAAGTFFANSFDISTGNNFLTTAHLDSVETLTIVAPGAIFIGNVTGDNSIVLEAQGGQVAIGNVIAGGGIDIDALTYITSGNITGNGVIDLDAGSSIGAGNIINTGNTSLNAGTSINVGSIDSGAGSVSLVTNSSYISGSFVTAGSIYADSGSDIFLGNLTAAGDIELVAVGDILVGNALAGEVIDLDAGGYIDGGNMTAGDSVFAVAGGPIDLLDISAGIVDPSNGYDADYSVGIVSGSTIDTGDIAALNIGLAAIGNITTGTIDAGNIFMALGGGNMSFGQIDADGAVYLAHVSMMPLGGDFSEGDFDPAPILAATPVASGGSIQLRGLVNAGEFVAAAGTTLTGTTIDSDSSIYAVSGGNMTLTDLDAGTSIFQRSNGLITENDLDAGSFIDVRSANGMALGDLVAGDYIDLRSNGAIGLLTALSGETINFQTLGTLTGLSITAGNSVLGQAVGAIQLGNISAGIVDQSGAPGAIYRVGFASDGSITTGNVNALGNVGFGTPLNLITGNLTSGGGIMALVGGNASFGAMTTGSSGYVYLGNHSMSPLGGPFLTFNRAPILALFPAATGGSIAINGPVNTGSFRASAGTTFNAGVINSTTNILIDSGGNMTLGNLSAGLIGTGSDSDDAIRLDSGGSLAMGNATALDGIDFDATGSVTGGNLTSGRSVIGSAGGAVILGNLSGGIINPQGPAEDDFSVGVESGTSISVGNVTGAESVGFASLGSVTTGTINAGEDFLVMATGNMSFGAITAGGRVYLADSSMFTAAGGGGENDDFDAALVFAANPVASGGSITINGPIATGILSAAAGTDFTTRAITADGIEAFAGGTAVIDGIWSVPDVFLVSNDINITSNGGIDGGAAGQITLNSINSDGALIGDGLTGTGYALSNAEFGRISSGTIRIVVGGNGGDADTLIGDLTITGPLAGSNIESSNGGVEFITLQEDGAALDGTLRVVGNVAATGFGPDNYLGFYTQNFELDAATGSISITGSGNALSGILELYAQRIHIAEGTLLDQLADNPQFAGYREALNRPATVQRAEGVIRAGSFDIEFGGSDNAGPYTLYVQNMGTTTVPAGFLLSAANVSDDGEGEVAPGSIDMAINGQIITGGGTLTGVAVRDLLVTEFGTGPFAAGSTINGCQLTGPCLFTAPPPPPPPRVDTPTRTDVPLNGNSGLGDGLFGNEPDIAGEGNGDSSSPIAAPNPLFDSRPLGASDDVNDPVSGAGNPSLYGANSDEDADAEVCDSTKDNKCKTNAKGDGK